MFILFSLIGFFITVLAAALVKRHALKHHIVDDPGVSSRKVH